MKAAESRIAHKTKQLETAEANVTMLVGTLKAERYSAAILDGVLAAVQMSCQVFDAGPGRRRQESEDDRPRGRSGQVSEDVRRDRHQCGAADDCQFAFQKLLPHPAEADSGVRSSRRTDRGTCLSKTFST